MKELTEKQLRILNIIWERGSATTAEIHDQLKQESGYARTTVATMLSRLEKYGFLGHQEEGKSFRYFPLVEKEEVQKQAVSSVISNLFSGDSGALVNHLVDEKQLHSEDIAEIRRLIEERRGKKK